MSELDKILGRYGGGRTPADTSPATTPDSVVNDDGESRCHCFSWMRGGRDRTPMLRLINAKGHIHSVSYGWIDACDYDGTGKISLSVNGKQVVLTGRNLHVEVIENLSLYTAIDRHRCVWIRESTQQENLSAAKTAVVIESIRW